MYICVYKKKYTCSLYIPILKICIIKTFKTVYVSLKKYNHQWVMTLYTCIYKYIIIWKLSDIIFLYNVTCIVYVY